MVAYPADSSQKHAYSDSANLSYALETVHVYALERKVSDLDAALLEQEKNNAAELSRLTAELSLLRGVCERLEDDNRRLYVLHPSEDAHGHYTCRVEWTVSDISKALLIGKDCSLWSPKFRAGGIDGMQLEFFPQGRESAFPRFCSLFLWCPGGWWVRYQLTVGAFARAPDEDEFPTNVGHGHSFFCPLELEVDPTSDEVVIRVQILEVRRLDDAGGRDLGRPWPVELGRSWPVELVKKELGIATSDGETHAAWRIHRISERLRNMPRGAVMWSRPFRIAGIREVVLEFYPNGSLNSTKDGYCGLYVRCRDATLALTLYVGTCRRGPIKVTFGDTVSGKGLPDFCPIADEVDTANDVLELGVELEARPSDTTLRFEA